MNETQAIEKYHDMICSIANKYAEKNKKIEFDDLYQEGAIGVLKGLRTYDNNRNMSLNTWIYNSIKWGILKAIRNANKNKDIKVISLESNLKDSEDLTIGDLIEDENPLYSFMEVEANLMLNFYREEIEKRLKGNAKLIALYILMNDNKTMKILRLFNIGASALMTAKREARRGLSANPYIRMRLDFLKRERMIKSINLRRDNVETSVQKREKLKTLNNDFWKKYAKYLTKEERKELKLLMEYKNKYLKH